MKGWERELERAWELHADGRLEQAIRLAERLLRTRSENPEALLVLAACARDQDHAGAALDYLERAARSDPDWPTPELWAAELLAEQPATLKQAQRRYRELIARRPELADAWYGLGLVCEQLEDEAGKREAWLATWRLDAAEDVEQGLSEAEVAAVAEAALAELPERARRLIAGVPILIADRPAREDVAAGLDPRLLGLFDGVPYPELSSVGGAPHLTQILLFRRNLERVADDEEVLREEIRTTLLHETGHFFGLSEQDLAELGLD
jgi:predicted Zn-dependent protease with MMP-like domain